jgi:hypothetical protein
MECPSCALEVDPDAETCPYCDYEFPRQKSSVGAAVWLFLLLMLWPLFKLLSYLFG